MEANLTSEKSEKLKTFKEYVLCEDTALCVRFLEEENWNVDEAVIKFLERPKTAQRSLLSRTATFASNLTTNIFSFFKSFFVADKKKEFEVTMNKFTKKYGPLHPEFSSDEFEKNVKRCASEKKLLFVYIHDSRPESKYSRGERYSVHDIDDFCRNALTSKPVVEFLNRNYISWMADVTSREAKNLGAQIRISKLPFLLIAAPSKNSAWVRVFQHEGRISEMTLLTCLLDSHSNFEDFTRREALRSEDRRKEQNLRKKQDEDYEKAINCDRDLHRDERDRAEKEKQERMERLKIEEEKRRKVEKLKKYFEDNEEPLLTEENVISIVFSLPDGKTISRRFNATDTIEKLYLFVESKDLDFGPNFVLLTIFPRTLFKDKNVALKEAGFIERSRLVVEPFKI